MMKIEFLIDSYDHYRRHVGLNRLGALYRAFYYEIMGREPWAKEPCVFAKRSVKTSYSKYKIHKINGVDTNG